MATTGHEDEIITVAGMKASLQKLKTDHIDGKAAKANITAGDYNKVTVNAQGIVTGGSNPTTLAGHGITDAYTKTETNGLVDTPHQNFVTVSATSQTTAATDVLPASGQAADTIYRVSNWDGSANSGAGGFDVTVYSEYAWDDVSNPNKYVFLCVKSAIGEVFDISVYNNNATYADLAAALGANGVNVPAEIRRGGMSVKFVQSSDNKYVQYRLMAQNFTTDVTNWSIAEEGVYVENPEFVYVKTDADGKILWAIKIDGGVYYGAGVPQQVKDYIEEKISSLSLDEYEDIVSFLSDYLGSDTTLKVMIDGIDAAIEDKLDKEGLDPDALNSVQAVENPEFIEVELDADDKILGGRKVDGTKFENNDVELNGNATVGGSLEVDGVVIKNSEDPENRSEITLDAEDKIISYRKDDGTLVENAGIVTPSLKLTDDGLGDFADAIKDAGYGFNGYDWSESDNIELPEPEHYALLNIVVNKLPINDGDLSEGYVQYYDGLGNYFKLSCELAAQGQTSRIFARTGGKGNYTLDLPKDVKFGSWVPQDSFHLKGCAKDATRSILPTSYKWAYMFMEYLDAQPDRVLMDEDDITLTHASGERITDWPRDARCLPDGFPVEVYVNGEYWGLYSWQLKKHRKNYTMDKKDYTSFFIDADYIMSDDFQHGLWNDGPADYWTHFEIKNPNNLFCMDGSKYDGDHPLELIDDTAVGIYDATNKAHKGSAQTKALIKDFSTRYLEVKGYINNNDVVAAKEKFNEYFDYNACMLVYIFNCLMRNTDSIKKNTLWAIYGGGKIAPMLWDLDGMYGQQWIGNTADSPSAYLWDGAYANAEWPLGLFWTLYETEIKAAYAELRENKVISVDTWKDIVFGWNRRVGQKAYERDITKWPETPSYRVNYTNTEYWTEVGAFRSTVNDNEWDENTQYAANDYVYVKMHPSTTWAMKYKAVQANTGVCPVTRFYDEFPVVGGFFDSPKRWERWITEQIRLCDVKMGYPE